MKKQLGLTFLEIMLALAIAAILLGVAVPSFVGSIRNSEMVSTANAFVGALHSARSEAVKSRARVTVCRSVNSTAPPACSAEGPDLLVFLNTTDDQVFNSGSDTSVRAVPWLKSTMTVDMGTIPNYLSFNSDGYSRIVGGGTVTGAIVMCGPSAEHHSRVITVSPTGRPVVQKHADATNPVACPTI